MNTGDAGKFFLLTQAYEVLSDPERRAAYDAKLVRHPSRFRYRHVN